MKQNEGGDMDQRINQSLSSLQPWRNEPSRFPRSAHRARRSAAAAAAVLRLSQNDYARAAIIAAEDPRLVAERVSYD
jgi:hypothetical protein